ncbi:MAG: hypothetical protein JNM12_10000 [Alphaproteobacteria bacterium]|nr:hypothetical protein [Alphaproteobacteria bacterium]
MDKIEYIPQPQSVSFLRCRQRDMAFRLQPLFFHYIPVHLSFLAEIRAGQPDTNRRRCRWIIGIFMGYATAQNITCQFYF